MRRYILFLLFLCLHWTARGQTAFEYRYWFDKDEGSVKTGTSATGDISLDADLSALTSSLHFIHMQVKDGDGTWSVPVSRCFVKTRTEKGDLAGYYWIDKEAAANQQMLAKLDGQLELDVSALNDGLHTLYMHVTEKNGTCSSALSRLFLKKSDPVGGGWNYRYWVDKGKPTIVSGKYTGEPMMIDVSGISDGFHILYLQVEGGGLASPPVMTMFIKVPPADAMDNMTYLCSVDGQLYEKGTVALSGGLAQWELDVADLPQGLHHLQVQLVTPDGAATSVVNHFFLRAITDAEYAGMKLYYSLDEQEFHSQADGYSDGWYHFDIDVASLEEGEHSLTYFLAAENGTSTDIRTATFIKIKTEDTGIADYRYEFTGKVNVYTTDGKAVKTDVEKDKALEGLRPGIYIVGDRKVVIGKQK